MTQSLFEQGYLKTDASRFLKISFALVVRWKNSSSAGKTFVYDDKWRR